MKKENKNDSLILIVIITLLSFILGVVSSPFIKERIEEIRLAFLRFMEVNHTLIVWSLVGVTVVYFLLLIATLPPSKKKTSQKANPNTNSGGGNNYTKNEDQKKKEEEEKMRKEKEEQERKRKENERRQKEEEENKRRENERRQKEEEEKHQKEEENKRQKEEEGKRQKEEEDNRKEEEKRQEEEENKRQKEEEGKRQKEEAGKEKYHSNSFFSLKVETIISRIETAQKGWEIFKNRNMDKYHLYSQIFIGFVEESLVVSNEKEDKRIYRKMARMFHPEGDNSGKIDGKVLELTFQKLTNLYEDHYKYYFFKKNI